MSRSIREIQQDFADNSGFENSVIWDFLSADQEDVMKEKIKQLIPDQEAGQSAVEERREILFQNVWAQRKYTNNNSLSAIIYVLVSKETDVGAALDSCEFSCHPVFRTRKCSASDSDSLDCCMIFVDETGRVYQRWECFVSENGLPAGTMVAPKRGVYTFDETGSVMLEACITPAASVAAKVLGTADKTSAVGGVLSACVPIAAVLSIPVAAPVIAVAGVVGLTAAGYSAVRSACKLVDRKTHDQSINLKDRHARRSWLGVAAGVVGFGASGVTRSVATVAATGHELSLITQMVINGMHISSIVFSRLESNGVLDMALKYKDDEENPDLEVARLSASLILFTHSIDNFELACRIVAETHNGVVQSYRRELSNRQRRMFDKMFKETIRIRGGTSGKIDIIRSVNDIPSNQNLHDNSSIESTTDSTDKPAILNEEVAADTQIFQTIEQQSIDGEKSTENTDVEALSQVHFDSDVQETLTNSTDNVWSLGSILMKLPNGTLIPLLNFGRRLLKRVMNVHSFKNALISMTHTLTEEAIKFLMKLVRDFVEKNLDEIEKGLQMFISAETVLNRFIKHFIKVYTQPTLEFLKEMEQEIIDAVRNYFMSWSTNESQDSPTKCKFCGNSNAPIASEKTVPLSGDQ